jgi:hypothetical protein
MLGVASRTKSLYHHTPVVLNTGNSQVGFFSPDKFLRPVKAEKFNLIAYSSC